MNRYYRRTTRTFRLKSAVFVAITSIGGLWIGIASDLSLLAGILLALGLLWGIVLIIEILSKPWCCIHPYFRSKLPLPGANTAFKGTRLANHLDEIDRLLEESGRRTISSYGYKDSLRNVECDWHQPSDGLTTFQAVLDIAESEERFAEVVAEVQSIINALNIAHDAGIEFCLHMRMGDGVSAQEFEVREGSYR